jgi:endonuclease-8
VPEGDTIHRAAARLRPVLVGQPVVRFDAARWSGPVPRPGETVDAVRAVGKHLLVDFSGGLTLRTHLRMSGRWDVYPTGARWRRSPASARAVVEVPGWVAVCFSAPDVALTRRDRVATAHLGPDLCAPDADIDAVVARARALADPSTTVGELLLDQRVAAGIGNVYKSDTLFLERLDPRTPVSELSSARLAAVYTRAHRLLRSNLGSGPRRTVPEGLAVYGRAGKPCRRCGARIERIVQGTTLPRSTYLCPRCQASDGEPSG